jgi:hypothetical protein
MLREEKSAAALVLSRRGLKLDVVREELAQLLSRNLHIANATMTTSRRKATAIQRRDAVWSFGGDLKSGAHEG